LKASTRAAAGSSERDEARRSRRIQAFDPAFRRDIETLTRASPALEDLADSFPGLLFALATGFGTPREREACKRAINSGLPLKTAAAILSFPWWVRRLPPQAYTHKMHSLPSGPEFSRRVVDLIPEETAHIGPWLWAIEHGYRGCDWRFALWTARWLSKDNRFLLRSDGRMHFRLLAAWAWHAGAEISPGHRLLRKPWTPSMGLRRALDELRAWRRRIALAVLLNAHGDDSWLAAGSANGYEFVALLTPEDFIRESETMENCLDQFADHFDSGFSRIFSVRRKDRTVATLEIAGHEGETSMPAIRQLRGRRNRKARPEVWRATYAWLGSQPLRPRHAPARIDRNGTNKALAELWLPYLQFLDVTGLSDEFASVIGLKARSVKRSARPGPKSRAAAQTRAQRKAAAPAS
jgi:hypothetical protein